MTDVILCPLHVQYQVKVAVLISNCMQWKCKAFERSNYITTNYRELSYNCRYVLFTFSGRCTDPFAEPHDGMVFSDRTGALQTIITRSGRKHSE